MGVDVEPVTIGRILDIERDRLFVGRHEELEQLWALCDPESAIRLVSISGPGGIGKSELLAAFSRIAERASVPLVWVDGADVTASEEGVTGAVEGALASAGVLLPAVAALFCVVVVIDRFELLSALETWFRERFLPSLAVTFRFVIAGRAPLTSAWSTHPSWRGVHVAMQLRSLASEPARDYLARRSIPAERRRELVSVTRGHPLALAMFADLVERDPHHELAFDSNPETVQTLLGALVDGAETQARREALWLLALAHHTTEELLAAVIDAREARPLYTFLDRLSFVRQTPRGLTPHDLVRDLLVADLTWRAVALRQRLIARAAAFYRARQAAGERLAPETFADTAYLWRLDLPIARHTNDGLYVSTPRPGDVPVLAALVARHHGPHNAALFERWAARGGELGVVRGSDDAPRGATLYLDLAALAPADRAADPVVAAIERELGGALDGVILMRCLVDRDAGEAMSSTGATLMAWEVERFIWSGDVKLGLSAWRDPANGLQGMPPGMLELWPQPIITLDDHPYRVVGTTAQGRDLASWFAEGLFAPLLGSAPHAKSLDPAAFAAAVRAALKDFHHPERLTKSPLVRAPLVTDTASAATRDGSIEALRGLLREAARELAGGSEAALDRAIIERTYFEVRVKQLNVAASLGLPFGTYRRRLANATDRIVGWLALRAGA